MKLSGLKLESVHSVVSATDGELLERSAAAKVGRCVIQFAIWLRTAEQALMLVIAVILMSMSVTPAFGQTPGGNIFGSNDQQIGNGVRSAIYWGRNAMFLLGVFFIGWGCLNIAMGKGWGRQVVGGALCMSVGSIIALVYSFAQGNAVDFDTDLGK